MKFLGVSVVLVAVFSVETSAEKTGSGVASLSSQIGRLKVSNCLDGNVKTVCKSHKENNPFFRMKYPTPVTVTEVKVQAPNNANALRLKNLVVIVTDTKPTKEKPAKGTQLGSKFVGPATKGQWISFKSEAGIEGKYVVVQELYKGNLILAEVKVTLKAGGGYVALDNGPGCSTEAPILSKSECKKAADALGYESKTSSGVGVIEVNNRGAPSGCLVGHSIDNWKHTFFNKHPSGQTGKKIYRSLCHQVKKGNDYGDYYGDDVYNAYSY